jgi:hypothetical protein
MKIERTQRGFEYLSHPEYPEEDPQKDRMLAQQSSIIGDYDDSMDRPGSSALWISEHHHLNRKEVAELINHLQHWLNTGHGIR